MICGCSRLSELHGVWSVILGERESGAEVFSEHLVAGQGLGEGTIDLFLELLSGVGGGALWGVLGEELLGLSSLLGGFLLEGLVGDSISLDSLNVDLGAGGEGVALVHSLDWDAVDLVWAGNAKKTRLELLEADDSLSSESACEEDEDSAWLNAGSELWSLRSASLWGGFDIIAWVPVVFLDHLSSKNRTK